uniref:Small ribosomal subunit protein uS9c n=1 Tax=Callipsygma wilsonis TaxID=2320807 RepID=A0A386B009_9CHLO|nr:ribosomal protein S9 [Callipsygma wilsonis]AYC65022.1 ribosomal protein S9 [Callipsygma wilsonis]
MCKMQYYSIGRRKCSVAKIWISKSLENEILLNKKSIKTIKILKFSFPFLRSVPLKMNIIVFGGGIKGQQEAISLALARALFKMNEAKFKYILNQRKLLTQDSRIKERKKYGLKKARKASQYSKR